MTQEKLQVAPMVGVTNEYFRYFISLISSSSLLYTEMLSTNSIRHGNILTNANTVNNARTCIQFAGNDPNELAYCAQLAQRCGYKKINLNVGCPSCRIKKGGYGAVLFKSPALVAACVAEMKKAVDIPITVKTRIGVDHHDSYLYLAKFVGLLLDSGCDELIIHARKAYLQGLSPKANRSVPPLRYDVVRALRKDFPGADIVLNGGINTLGLTKTLFCDFNSLMLGRVVEKNPLILRDIENKVLGLQVNNLTREEILTRYLSYINIMDIQPHRIQLLKPLMGLYHGTNKAKKWHKMIIESFSSSFSSHKLSDFAHS